MITDPNYKTNPERKDYSEFDRIMERFKGKHHVKCVEQLWIYQAISKNWCIGKSVLDIGCGIGWGSNILVREAIGVYGVDVSEDSIHFAKEMFENQKLKFDVMDITKYRLKDPMKHAPFRPVATFDVVCAIEVIEHIDDYEAVLEGIKQFYDPKRRTVFFISSPNRNSDKIAKDKPRNEFHVREWTAGELYDLLTKHFNAVVLYGADKDDMFTTNYMIDGNSKATPVLAKCEFPKF